MSEFSEFHGRVVAGPVYALSAGGKPCAFCAVVTHDGEVRLIRSSSPNGLSALEESTIGSRLHGAGRVDDDKAAIDCAFIRADDGWGEA
jgi:hypothetical protein